MNHTKAWWRPAGYAVVGLGIGLVLATFLAALAVIGEIRDTQLEGTPTGKRLLASSDRILDCTETDGECFKANQRRLADAVSDIGATNILAVVCALQVPNGTPLNDALDQVTACVVDRLKLQPKS